MEVNGHRNIGKPKLRWSDVIRTYTNDTGLQEEEEEDYIGSIVHWLLH